MWFENRADTSLMTNEENNIEVPGPAAKDPRSTERRHDPQPRACDPSSQDQGGFYWVLPVAQQSLLRTANLILEDEGYLAHDIEWGRRLLAVPEEYVAVRDIDRDWEGPISPEGYSDALAAILQAAIEAGFDARYLVELAMGTQAAVRAQAAAAIRRF